MEFTIKLIILHISHHMKSKISLYFVKYHIHHTEKRNVLSKNVYLNEICILLHYQSYVCQGVLEN
jgi:hypothetical protein